MERVELFTAQGQLVAEVTIPPFQYKKGLALLWGSRLFIWNEEAGQFREGCLYVVVDLSNLL